MEFPWGFPAKTRDKSCENSKNSQFRIQLLLMFFFFIAGGGSGGRPTL